jgi:hypothetical protein
MPPQPGIGGRAGSKAAIRKRFPTQVKKGWLIPGESFRDQRNRLRKDPSYVKHMQRKLREVGFNIAVDGIWGPQTSAAYHAYTTLRDRQNSVTLWTKGAGAAIKEYQQKLASERRRVQANAVRMQKALQMAVKTGDLSPLDMQIAIAQFWTKLGGGQYGQFDAQATTARRQGQVLQQLKTGQAQNREILYKQYQQQQKDRNQGLLGRIVGSVMESGHRFTAGFDVGENEVERQKAAIKGSSLWDRLRKGALGAGQPFIGALTGSLATTRTAGLIRGKDWLGISARLSESIDSAEERSRLSKMGLFENAGERFSREIYGQGETRKALGDEARRRGLTGRDRAEFIKREYEKRRAAYVSSGGAINVGFGAREQGDRLLAKAANFAAAIALDPVNLTSLGAKITFIGARNAPRVLGTTAGQAMLRRAGLQVAKATARGDPNLIVKTIPGLQSASAAQLRQALVSPQAAQRWLTQVARTSAANPARVKAAQDALRSLQGADRITSPIAERMLATALGAEWRPRLGLGARAAGRAAGATTKLGVDPVWAVDQIAKMSLVNAAAKRTALTYEMRRVAARLGGGKGISVGIGRRVVHDPRQVALAARLREFAGADELEGLAPELLALRRKQIGVFKQGPRIGKAKLVTRNTIEDWNHRQMATLEAMATIPEGAIRDTIQQRFNAVTLDVVQHMEDQLQNLTDAQKELLTKDNAYLEARRHVLQASALKTFGTESYTKFAAGLFELDAAIRKLADVRLDSAMLRKLSNLEKDVFTAKKIADEAYAHTEKKFNEDVLAFEAYQRRMPSEDVRRNLAQRFGERFGRAVLSFADMTWSKNTVNIENIDERVTFVEDLARRYGLTYTEQVAAKTAAYNAGITYDSAVTTINDILLDMEEIYLSRRGLTAEEIIEYMSLRKTSLNKWLQDNGGIGTRAVMSKKDIKLNRAGVEQLSGEFAPEGGPRLYGRVYDPDCDCLVTRTDPQAVTQAANYVAVPSFDEMSEYVRVAKQQRMADGFRKSLIVQGGGAARAGLQMFTRGFVYPVTRLWKFTVLVAPRYVLRVAGIEERHRMLLTQGMGSALSIGLVTRRMNNHMMRHQQAGFTNWRAIGMEDVPDFFVHKHFAGAGELDILDPSDDGFLENWWHLVNHQVSPETDPLAGMLIDTLHREGTDEWRQDIDDAVAWLRSDDGRVYFGHYRSLNKGATTPEEVVEAWTTWAKSLVPTDELAQARKNGLLDLRTLKEHPEWMPDEIYGRGFKRTTTAALTTAAGGDLLGAASQGFKILGRMVMESPTTNLNRNAFAFIEYRKELDALLDAGIDMAQASKMANDFAVDRTNKILYDASRRSRAASAMEPWFPFQAAKEESVRVWARQIKENPQRAALIVEKYALAFNAGEDEGVFYKDEYGEWRMRIPTGPLADVARFLGDHLPEWVPMEDQFEALGRDEMWQKMEISFKLRDLLLIQSSQMPLADGFIEQYALGAVLPQPGGPVWQVALGALFNNHKHLYPKNGLLQGWLDPYNNVQNWHHLGGNWYRYFFGAMTGRTWDNEESNRMLQQAIREFYFRHGRDPTPQEIEDMGKTMFLTKGLLSFVFPASLQTKFEGQGIAQAKLAEWEAYVKKFAPDQNAVSLLLLNNPELQRYFTGGKYDPELNPYRKADGRIDWAKLQAENPQLWQAIRFDLSDDDYRSAIGEDRWADFVRGRRAMDPATFLKVAKEGDTYGEMMGEFYAAIQRGTTGGADDRAAALKTWEDKWRNHELFKERKDQLVAFYRLDAILKMPDNEARRDRMIELQLDYGWTTNRLNGLIEKRQAKHVAHDGYLSARTVSELEEEFKRGPGASRGQSMEDFVAHELTPHEANNWLAFRMSTAENDDDWAEANKLRGMLWGDWGNVKWGNKANVLVDKPFASAVDEATKDWEKRKKNVRTEISRLYDRLNGLKAASAAISARWDRAKATHKFDPGLGEATKRLSAQKAAIYAQIRGLQNSVYNANPMLNNVMDEVKFMHAMNDHLAKGGKAGSFDFQAHGFRTRESDEEQRWEKMPPRVQHDYVAGLKSDIAAGRKQWDWMTEFQKDLLRDVLGVSQGDIERWRKNGPSDGAGGGGGWKKWKFKKWEWKVWGHKYGDGFGELAFALEMFKQYNKRGNMPEPTAELAQLKRIGNNPILRADFIRRHPKVREWIRLGPMMQMPVGSAEMVRFIMQKYDRWEDFDGPSVGPNTANDVTEVAFARLMLQKYTKRKPGEQAPRAYELWQKMPTGKAKADYIAKHPEIGRWLNRGPMANMPDEYQEVVRDIMMRFGLWTDKQDPLGRLIERYYQLPSYARQNFLQQHPEIMAYWRALRSGPERVMFDLAQRYFALTDSSAKRAFLEAHPELRGYFVDERHRRYERFLNNVAQYLGSYPDLANHYMRDQTRFLKELVAKYGERPLVAQQVGRVNVGSGGDRVREPAPERKRDVA